jgi:hypothetical protein
MLHWVNVSSSGYGSNGARKPGSTDANLFRINLATHTWLAIGCTSQTIDLYIDHLTNIDVYLVGYFTDETVFFTNPFADHDKSLADFDAWTDIDISADTGADTAIAGIFLVQNIDATTGRLWGLQHNDSTDDDTGSLSTSGGFGCVIIGVDGSEICEGYADTADVNFYLLGYIKSGATFITNPVADGNYSLANTDFQDLTALPAGAIGGFFRVDCGTSVLSYTLEKNGTAEGLYYDTMRSAGAFVECDANRIIDGQIESTSVDFFLTGYATAAAGGATASVSETLSFTEALD